MRELTLGVIGTGYLGRIHARILSEKKVPGVRLGGIHDANPARAAEIAAEFGTQPFDSAAALAQACDGLVVATPTVSHRAIAERVWPHLVALLAR